MPPADPPAAFADADPAPCAACHGRGTGCCQLAEGTDKMFGLTGAEVERIVGSMGLEPAEFCQEDRATAEFLRFLGRISPVFARTMPGGLRLRLKVDDDGRCVFLGDRGCRLPVEARPHYCRLYPFWFMPDGRLMVLANPQCLAQEDARHWKTVLAALGADTEGLRAIFRQLEAEAARHQAEADSQE